MRSRINGIHQRPHVKSNVISGCGARSLSPRCSCHRPCGFCPASRERSARLGGTRKEDDSFPYMDAPTLSRLSFSSWLIGRDCTRTFGLLVRLSVAVHDGFCWKAPNRDTRTRSAAETPGFAIHGLTYLPSLRDYLSNLGWI